MAYLQPEDGIRELLLTETDVTDLLADDVIAPLEDIPRTAEMPYIGIMRESADPAHHLGGVVASELWQGESEVVSFADTKVEATDLADAVRGVLDGAEVTTATVGSNSVTFTRLHLMTEQQETIRPSEGSERAVYTVIQRYGWAAQP